MSFGASDLHLRAGSYPVIRVTGELKPLSGVSRMTQDETLEMAFSMMSNRQKQHFKEAYEVDIGYGVSGLGRFRVNIFQQRNSIGIVLVGVFYQREDPADAARAKAWYDEALAAYTEHGYPPYRATTMSTPHALDANPRVRDLLASIKRAVDPQNLLAPGRYGTPR